MSRPVSLPTRIFIGTFVVHVSHVEDNDPRLEDARGISLLDGGKTEILINKTLVGPQLLEVVWHEVTHVINWINDLDDGMEEEKLTTVHGCAWPLLLVANPKFQRWLTWMVNSLRKDQISG